MAHILAETKDVYKSTVQERILAFQWIKILMHHAELRDNSNGCILHFAHKQGRLIYTDACGVTDTHD